MSPRLVSMGELLWDVLPSGPQLGGAPGNFACHAALLGARVTLLSAVGDDPRGREAVGILRRVGVDTSLIQRVPDAPTGVVNVTVGPAGQPAFEIRECAAWDRIAWQPELTERIATSHALYFGTLGQRAKVSRGTIRHALQTARSSAIPRVLDVNLRPPFFDAALIRESVAQASLLKLSDDELDRVARACGIEVQNNPVVALRALLARFELDLVAMTRGAEGALLVSSTEIVDQPGVPVVVRDTVGAGDSFTAALVVGWLRGDPLRVIARVACETAAAVCTHAGAVPLLPSKP